jgi:O-antigen/teichoic acid export membrane protein
VAVFAPALAGILGEPRAAAPMRVLALALPSIFLGMSFSHLILAEGRARLVLRLYAVFALASLAANWVLIPRFTYFAVAAMTVTLETCLLLALGTYWVVQRRLRLELRTLWSVPLAAGLAAAARALLDRAVGPPQPSVAAHVVILVAGGMLLASIYVGVTWRLGLLRGDVLRAFLPARGGAAAPVPREPA